jgi:superfamily II DNA or RNA helicase
MMSATRQRRECFEPEDMPEFLYEFQAALVQWAVRLGRAAIFADCGMGKTAMQLAWADQVYRHTGRPVLILTPLAVAPQTQREGEKFGVDAACSFDGSVSAAVTITNYDKLHKFERSEFTEHLPLRHDTLASE